MLKDRQLEKKKELHIITASIKVQNRMKRKKKKERSAYQAKSALKKWTNRWKEKEKKRSAQQPCLLHHQGPSGLFRAHSMKTKAGHCDSMRLLSIKILMANILRAFFKVLICILKRLAGFELLLWKHRKRLQRLSSGTFCPLRFGFILSPSTGSELQWGKLGSTRNPTTKDCISKKKKKC